MLASLGMHSLFSWPFLLEVIVVLAAISSGILAIVGAIAFARHGSVPYLLIALALVFLLGKAVVGMFSITGLVSVESHNLIEHALDFFIATLLLGAILEARNPDGCRLGRWIGFGTDR